ncbi:MAG: hypothetical protein ABJB98_09000 [Actinomycetota bacterium]
MTDSGPDEPRVDERAALLPEETAVGSDNPHRQAEVILEDSDRRTAEPEQTLRESTQTPDRDSPR